MTHSLSIMKKFSISILAVVALAFSAFAGDQPTVFTGATGTSCAIAPATTNSTAPVFSVKDSSTLGLQCSFSCNATNALSVTLNIEKSINNSQWITYGSWAITANGTNLVKAGTNLTAGAFPYWRISTIENPNTTTSVTNLFLRGFTKSGI